MTTLYIHIPFCRHKCFYCSFVVSVGQEEKIGLYLDCLKKEMQWFKDTKIKSIYIGGGTPTLLSTKYIEILARMIKENFLFEEGIEWTIEANPDGINVEKIKILTRVGINRVSLGIQSLQNKYLKFLGRNHDQHKAKDIFYLLRDKGIENINLDLMYDFPNQTMGELQQDVQEVVKLGSEHLSLYALTPEEGSRFYTKKIFLSDNQSQTEKYIFVTKFLEDHGLNQYEVSNFSKEGKESEHNKHYWLGGGYIGLGVGAHSYIKGKRYWNVSRLTKYIKGIKEGISVVDGSEFLTEEQRLIENLLFRLRMNQGVDVSFIEKKFQCSIGEERKLCIKRFVKNGFLEQEGVFVKTTLKGRLVLDELSIKLI